MSCEQETASPRDQVTKSRAKGAEADGGEGGAPEPDGSRMVAAVEQPEQPWAPTDTEELLDVIATRDYGVSDDRSVSVPHCPWIPHRRR